ncbi:MAG: glycosyltransferase [Acetobacteraceae bacterium]|nr:glycosyltransferase [Acetobacteraceae bacterium]
MADPAPSAASRAGVLVVGAAGEDGGAADAFLALRSRAEVAFLCDGAGTVPPLGTPLHQPWGPDVFALHAAEGAFSLAGPHPSVRHAFARLLERLGPAIVDFHGLPWFGLDALAQAKRVLPAARVVLTLDAARAEQAGLAAPPAAPWQGGAHGALPTAAAAADAFLREALLRRFLPEADRIVVRGPLLAERCAGLGVPPDRITVLPHVPPPPAPPRPPPPGPPVFGCFPAALDAEGEAVLAAALAALAAPPGPVRPLRIAWHGPPGSLAHLAAAGVLLPCPPVPGRSTDEALQDCHALLLPGHSRADPPALAMRALANGRPVIFPDGGGPAALLREGADGFRFRAGSGLALAALLADLAAAPGRLAALSPGAGQDPAGATVALYDSLLAGTA